jgi:hypothetical protein
VRLRTLTEEECYARCYGGRREESVSVVRVRRSGDRGTSDGSPVRSSGREEAETREAA